MCILETLIKLVSNNPILWRQKLLKMIKTLKKNLLVLIVLLTLCITLPAQWFGNIVPTQTTLSEVEQMVAIVPRVVSDDKRLFKLKEGNLFVGISLGECIRTSWGSWKVEKEVVLHVIFHPKKDRKPSYYKLDSAQTREGYDSGHKTYKSEEKGLYYSTQFGKVSGINYL